LKPKIKVSGKTLTAKQSRDTKIVASVSHDEEIKPSKLGLSTPKPVLLAMATGTVIPVGAKLKMLELEIADNRHKELVDLQKKAIAILEKNKKSKKPKKKRSMHLGTESSLNKLREIRLKEIEDYGRVPKRAKAMNEAGIDPKTWRDHDPEFYAKWDDLNYR